MTKATRPLTPAMKGVVDAMRDGWQLGSDQGRAWMQRQLMHGGETREVRFGTVTALLDRGVIRGSRLRGDPFWLNRYVLVDAKREGQK